MTETTPEPVNEDNLKWDIIDDDTLGLTVSSKDGAEHCFLLRRQEVYGLRGWFDQWLAETSVETMLGLEDEDDEEDGDAWIV